MIRRRGIRMHLEIFATCPPWRGESAPDYCRKVADAARWSEAAGDVGILVYTDNGLIDPWLIAQVILRETTRLCPLIAVQPVYLHPVTAARMVASLAQLNGRRVFLNMVAGGFRNDLLALGDETEHDDRYTRLVEYTTIVKTLLSEGGLSAHSGTYYDIENARLTPSLDPGLFPGLMVSGSSDAGLAAARAIGATAIRYPKPPGEETGALGNDMGVRLGVIARDTADEAWRVARERFPEDRKGQITHKLAIRVSDSNWHHQLSVRHDVDDEHRDPYWLGPFQNYKTFCPYLVGSYSRVSEEIAGYVRGGFRTFILDVPPSPDELAHSGIVFQRALTDSATGSPMRVGERDISAS
jgi:alkanesulfonate monooxygenase